MKRYERLTEEITASILSGLLQAGDRLPSVRQTRARRGVSPSTVFKAYYLLEARGLIPVSYTHLLGRLGEPDEIAALVAFICSDAAAFMTGSNVAMNGGQHMY